MNSSYSQTRSNVISIAVFVLAFLTRISAAAQPNVTAVIDGLSSRETSLTDVNANQTAVGFYLENNSKRSPLIYIGSTGSLDPSLSGSVLNQINSDNAWLNSINNQGALIGNYYDSNGVFRPFRVDANGVATPLPTLNGGSGEAYAMTGDVIVGSVVNSSGHVQAAYWLPPYMTINLIGMPQGVVYSLASAVSANGRIVGTLRQAPDAVGVEFSGFTTEIGSVSPITVFGYPGRNLGVRGIMPNGSIISATLGTGRRDHVRLDSLSLTIQEFPQASVWTESVTISGVFDSLIGGLFRDTVGPIELTAMIWSRCGGTVTVNDFLSQRGAHASEIEKLDHYVSVRSIGPRARYIVGDGVLNGQATGWIVDLGEEF